MPAITVVPTQAKGSLVSVMSNAQIDAAEKSQRDALSQAQNATPEQDTGLGGYIRMQWEIMRNHRDNTAGWSQRMLAALRTFDGQYNPQQLVEIQKFGGSTAYARLIAVKCRGASSLLRDVYLTVDRPWGLDPPTDPEVPTEIFKAITDKVQSEIMVMSQGGEQPTVEDIRTRTFALMAAARQAAKVKSAERVDIAEEKVDTLLTEGGFYDALSEFFVDLPLYPFACIKGPVVKMVPTVDWKDGAAYVDVTPRLCWQRVSPFDLWWTPGVSTIEDAAVIERIRFTRAELNDLLDLPGFDHDAVKAVLTEYKNGYTMYPDSTDSSRAVLESRENPMWNRSAMIECLEFHGNVQGETLLGHGFTSHQIPDPMRDYMVEGWLIGTHLIKVQLSPSPRKRHPYFITSFEKVPGTPVGNALPDLLADMQDAANAALRSLLNNMAMSSGPQIQVNDDRLAPGENGDEIYPWKRWHVTNDPINTNAAANKPIEFFQPESHAQELLGIYQAFSTMADDISAIPRYLQGNSPGGGAGRTASGLAMLMGNASKVLQTVAANVDRDVLSPALKGLVDMILLTDTTDLLDGTENVVVKGVAVAMQRETQRARQMEFLQATANPMDAQIIGPKGRAAILREVSKGLGMPGEEIVPTPEALDAQQKQAATLAQSQGQPGHAQQPLPPNKAPGEAPNPAAAAQGSQPSPPNQDMGPRTNLATPRPRIAGGAG